MPVVDASESKNASESKIRSDLTTSSFNRVQTMVRVCCIREKERLEGKQKFGI